MRAAMMTKNKAISQTLWTALITPMNQKGEIDYDSLAFCARQQELAGNSILLLGSTGESLALSTIERRNIVAFIGKQKLAVPIMVGVGGYQLTKQFEWLDYCAEWNINAYLLTAPMYSKPGKLGQCVWFEKLLDYAQAPCMVYNVPSRTGCYINPDVLRNLKDHKNFWALKEASGDLKNFREYYEANPKLKFYSGDDGMIDQHINLGVCGLVSVISNLWPKQTKAYLNKILKNNIETTTLKIWQKAIAAAFTVTNPIAIKALLAERKWIQTPHLRLPLIHSELSGLNKLLISDAEIKNWYAQINLNGDL